jgi:hypothetical protein
VLHPTRLCARQENLIHKRTNSITSFLFDGKCRTSPLTLSALLPFRSNVTRDPGHGFAILHSEPASDWS